LQLKIDHLKTKFDGLLSTVKVLNESIKLKRASLKEVQDKLSGDMDRFQSAKANVINKQVEIDALKRRLDTMSAEERAIKDALREIDCKSEEELDRRLEAFEQRIAHEVIPLQEERNLIRDIRKLQRSRKTIQDLAARRADLDVCRIEREEINHEIRDVRGELDILRGDKDIVWEGMSSIMEVRDTLREELKKIEAERETLAQHKDKVWEELSAARDEMRSRDAAFFEKVRLRDRLTDMVAKGQAKTAQEAAVEFVDKYCKRFCEDDSFRSQYLALTERSRLRRYGVAEDDVPTTTTTTTSDGNTTTSENGHGTATKSGKGMKELIEARRRRGKENNNGGDDTDEDGSSSPRTRAQRIIDQAMSEAQAEISAKYPRGRRTDGVATADDTYGDAPEGPQIQDGAAMEPPTPGVAAGAGAGGAVEAQGPRVVVGLGETVKQRQRGGGGGSNSSSSTSATAAAAHGAAIEHLIPVVPDMEPEIPRMLPVEERVRREKAELQKLAAEAAEKQAVLREKKRAKSAARRQAALKEGSGNGGMGLGVGNKTVDPNTARLRAMQQLIDDAEQTSPKPKHNRNNDHDIQHVKHKGHSKHHHHDPHHKKNPDITLAEAEIETEVERVDTEKLAAVRKRRAVKAQGLTGQTTKVARKVFPSWIRRNRGVLIAVLVFAISMGLVVILMALTGESIEPRMDSFV